MSTLPPSFAVLALVAVPPWVRGIAEEVCDDLQLHPRPADDPRAADFLRARAVVRDAAAARYFQVRHKARLTDDEKTWRVRNTTRKVGALQFASLQVEWVTGIAVRRAKRFKHRPDSDETADVVGEAIAYMTTRVLAFNPRTVPPGGTVEGLFRGWFCRDVLTRCTRHCRRLENAGTYNTRRHTPGEEHDRAVYLSRLQAPLVSPEPDEAPAEPFCVCDTSHG